MTKTEKLALIEGIGIIPAIRVSAAADAVFAAEAVFNGGIPIVEITMTVPEATRVLSELARSNPEAILGAGTVLDVNAARRCLDAGAAFLTSTGLDLDLVDFALKHNVLLFPGALTPTEVMMANKMGADFIKVFPCSSMGGASYIRALKSPFPHVRLIAAGGVNQQTAADFIRSGASAIGVGKDLLPIGAIQARNANWINELARRFRGMVKEARGTEATGSVPLIRK